MVVGVLVVLVVVVVVVGKGGAVGVVGVVSACQEVVWDVMFCVSAVVWLICGSAGLWVEWALQVLSPPLGRFSAPWVSVFGWSCVSSYASPSCVVMIMMVWLGPALPRVSQVHVVGAAWVVVDGGLGCLFSGASAVRSWQIPARIMQVSWRCPTDRII